MEDFTDINLQEIYRQLGTNSTLILRVNFDTRSISFSAKDPATKVIRTVMIADKKEANKNDRT